jgi:hypothetical protein
MKKPLSLFACAVVAFAMISSCSKKKDDPSPSNSNNPNSAWHFYFTGTFDDVAYSQATTTNTATGYNDGVGSSSVGNYVDPENSDEYVYEFWEGSYWTNITNNGGQLDEKDALVMRVHKSFNYMGENEPSRADVKNLFAAGTYTNFSIESTDAEYPTTEGWDVVLTETNGKVWSSFAGTASQTGSYIKIDSQKEVTLGTNTFLSAKGSISCKLYDDSGNVKVLEGTFEQLFVDYEMH